MNRTFKENYLPYLIACFLAMFTLNQPFAVFPNLFDKGPTWLSLDDSGRMALNYALLKKMIWGKEVMFVYGPLGFFATRIGWGISRWAFLLFDVFVVANFMFVFKDLIKNAVDKFLAIAIIFCVMLSLSPSLGSGLSFILVFFIFYWIYKTYETQNTGHFIAMSFCIVLAFYIKLNTGLTGVLFLILHLCNLLIFKKISILKAVGLFSVPVILIIAVSIPLHVSIWPYIKGASELIRGANDVQYLNQDHYMLERNITIIFCGMVTLYIWYAFSLLKKKNYSQLLYVAFGILYIFLLRKQSISRNDPQHLWEFFRFGPVVLLFGNLFSNRDESQKKYLRSVFIIVLFAIYSITSADSNDVEQTLATRFGSIRAYKRQFREYGSHSYLDQKDKRVIPDDLLRKIGNSTIDVFPWDCNLLFQNKLNYTPRPIYQTYNAFTNYLEKMNYDFYLGKAPVYVIYDYDAIDNRYPFNDECLVNLYLAKNYAVTDTFTSSERTKILLQKKEGASVPVIEKLKEERVCVLHEIPVNDISLLKMNIDYNWKGKLLAFWSKPSPINIMFMRPDGEWLSYKTSTELLRTGMMVEKLVLDTKDFYDLFLQKDKLPPIRKIKLDLDPSYFLPEMTVGLYKIK